MSYTRRYYYHRMLRRDGFVLNTQKKTIEVKESQVITAGFNKYVCRLRDKYHYGVQFINPMIQ